VSGNALAQLLPLLLLVVLVYFLMIRPARRRAQQVSRLQAALSVGDEVMLSSGIFGTVESVFDDRVNVKVADGVVLVVHRGAVNEIVRDVPAESATAADGEPGGAEDQRLPEQGPDDPGTHEDTTRGAN
jgi:preprotein translocase subunit YajC